MVAKKNYIVQQRNELEESGGKEKLRRVQQRNELEEYILSNKALNH